MNKTLTYIKRKASPNFHSIEGLFDTIMEEVSKSYNTNVDHAKFSGGSPFVLFKNCLGFKKYKNTIYHITGDVHYMALVSGKNTVLTIHDIGSAIQGHLLKRLYIKLFWFWLPALCVKRITVISEFTKQELVKIIPFAKVKIHVVSNPVNQSYVPESYSFNTVYPTLLCIGTKSNKNLERLFAAITPMSCKLHIVGKLSDAQLMYLKTLKIDYQNSFNLSQEEIKQAYVDCDLLCFPSTYEGFGMPIIEAQAIGRPVLTSNFGAMLEVANDSACLIDSYSTKAIRNGIHKIISEPHYRLDLIKKGFENIKRFQLETIAKQYICIYEELVP